MIPGLIAFFQALPAFLTLISQLGNVIDRLVKVAQQNNLNAWIDNLEKQIDGLENAKTADDKLAAAQSLAGVIRGIGS